MQGPRSPETKEEDGAFNFSRRTSSRAAARDSTGSIGESPRVGTSRMKSSDSVSSAGATLTEQPSLSRSQTATGSVNRSNSRRGSRRGSRSSDAGVAAAAAAALEFSLKKSEFDAMSLELQHCQTEISNMKLRLANQIRAHEVDLAEAVATAVREERVEREKRLKAAHQSVHTQVRLMADDMNRAFEKRFTAFQTSLADHVLLNANRTQQAQVAEMAAQITLQEMMLALQRNEIHALERRQLEFGSVEQLTQELKQVTENNEKMVAGEKRARLEAEQSQENTLILLQSYMQKCTEQTQFIAFQEQQWRAKVEEMQQTLAQTTQVAQLSFAALLTQYQTAAASWSNDRGQLFQQIRRKEEIIAKNDDSISKLIFENSQLLRQLQSLGVFSLGSQTQMETAMRNLVNAPPNGNATAAPPANNLQQSPLASPTAAAAGTSGEAATSSASTILPPPGPASAATQHILESTYKPIELPNISTDLFAFAATLPPGALPVPAISAAQITQISNAALVHSQPTVAALASAMNPVTTASPQIAAIQSGAQLLLPGMEPIPGAIPFPNRVGTPPSMLGVTSTSTPEKLQRMSSRTVSIVPDQVTQQLQQQQQQQQQQLQQQSIEQPPIQPTEINSLYSTLQYAQRASDVSLGENNPSDPSIVMQSTKGGMRSDASSASIQSLSAWNTSSVSALGTGFNLGSSPSTLALLQAQHQQQNQQQQQQATSMQPHPPNTRRAVAPVFRDTVDSGTNVMAIGVSGNPVKQTDAELPQEMVVGISQEWRRYQAYKQEQLSEKEALEREKRKHVYADLEAEKQEKARLQAQREEKAKKAHDAALLAESDSNATLPTHVPQPPAEKSQSQTAGRRPVLHFVNPALVLPQPLQSPEERHLNQPHNRTARQHASPSRKMQEDRGTMSDDDAVPSADEAARGHAPQYIQTRTAAYSTESSPTRNGLSAHANELLAQAVQSSLPITYTSVTESSGSKIKETVQSTAVSKDPNVNKFVSNSFSVVEHEVRGRQRDKMKEMREKRGKPAFLNAANRKPTDAAQTSQWETSD